MAETFLTDLHVVELGERLAAGLCGALLQRLGAEVTVVESPAGSRGPHRAVLGAGKGSLLVDPGREGDTARLMELLARADVVITSSDQSSRIADRARAAADTVPVICDVSAFGTTGPLAGEAYTDAMMQAFAGLMDTTGMPDEAPVASAVPITECTTAVFAAAGVVAALRDRRADAGPHRVEVAMFDTAVSMLSTFLPTHFIGGAPRRIGNRHPSMSPWNTYAARDGWVLLCSASDEMWGRVCEVIGRPELRQDERFAKMGGRVRHAVEADDAITPWLGGHTVEECVAAFNAASVPCGPVHTIMEVLADESLRERGAFCTVTAEGKELRVPGRLVHGAPAQGRLPGEGRPGGKVERAARVPGGPRSIADARPGVLAGLRVVEMGSYTTAPLAARNLGALGAYVVKAEPPTGELSRASPPYRDGQSYFCTLSNSDKRSVAVDLRKPAGRTLFRDLLARADVFVENMKPGVLERYGFSPDEVARINPRLVYCSVSGYGASSALAERPAMDSTIQGAAGVMDLTREGGVPFKVGISISDLLGGQFALLAILAGLEYRDRTGTGQFIDLSMQELSAWLTQFAWNGGVVDGAGRVLRCRDGWVFVERADSAAAAQPALLGLSRAEVVATLAARGVRGVPVNTVSEVATHAHTLARGLIVERPAANGRTWPLLACPIRLTPSPAVVRRAFSGIGEDLQEVLRDWNIPSERA